MSIKIDKHVPIDPNVGRGAARKWPFADMEVGDSIALDNQKELNAVRQSAWHYAKKNGVKFGSTSYEDGSGRIWRIR